MEHQSLNRTELTPEDVEQYLELQPEDKVKKIAKFIIREKQND